MNTYRVMIKSGTIVLVDGASIEADSDADAVTLAVLDGEGDAIAIFAPGLWHYAVLDTIDTEDH